MQRFDLSGLQLVWSLWKKKFVTAPFVPPPPSVEVTHTLWRTSWPINNMHFKCCAHCRECCGTSSSRGHALKNHCHLFEKLWIMHQGCNAVLVCAQAHTHQLDYTQLHAGVWILIPSSFLCHPPTPPHLTPSPLTCPEAHTHTLVRFWVNIFIIKRQQSVCVFVANDPLAYRSTIPWLCPVTKDLGSASSHPLWCLRVKWRAC